MSKQQYHLVPDIPDDLLQHYLQQPIIAVDTELHGLKLHRDEICLVQLCDDADNVCLVKPKSADSVPNLRTLMTNQQVTKLFHFALTDVGFFKTSLNMEVAPFRCTKVMSKLVRTYTQEHGLRALCGELLGIKIEKTQQQTNWAAEVLSQEQMEYAAKDVLYLVSLFRKLEAMIQDRGNLASGQSLWELHEESQAILPGYINLLAQGYGDLDRGWQTSLFSH